MAPRDSVHALRWEDNADRFGEIRRSRQMTTGRTWESNADEFGAITNGTAMGWSLAVLVACSVDNTSANQHGDAVTGVTAKVGVNQFAARAGVSNASISRYFNGWAKAIEKGAPVPPATDLSPSDVGTFQLPAKPFNGPDGYVKTRTGSAASGTVETTVKSVEEGKNELTKGLAASAPALTKLVDTATPAVIEDLVSGLSDDAFEALSDAIVQATTPEPLSADEPAPDTAEALTSTTFRPAPTPSPAKISAARGAADKIRKHEIRETVERFKREAPISRSAEAAEHHHRTDGARSPAQELLRKLLADDELWNTEVVLHWLDRTLEAVLAYPGALGRANETFIQDRLDVMKDRIARIENAVEAKRTTSSVPDTLPDDWQS